MFDALSAADTALVVVDAQLGVQMMTDINEYMDFALTMFLGFGAAFEMPVAVMLLVLTGLVKRIAPDTAAIAMDEPDGDRPYRVPTLD